MNCTAISRYYRSAARRRGGRSANRHRQLLADKRFTTLRSCFETIITAVGNQLFALTLLLDRIIHTANAPTSTSRYRCLILLSASECCIGLQYEREEVNVTASSQWLLLPYKLSVTCYSTINYHCWLQPWRSHISTSAIMFYISTVRVPTSRSNYTVNTIILNA